MYDLQNHVKKFIADGKPVYIQDLSLSDLSGLRSLQTYLEPYLMVSYFKISSPLCFLFLKYFLILET